MVIYDERCTIEIEQCTCDEYLRQSYGDEDGELSADGLACLLAQRDALESLKGIRVIGAQRQRILYHGWNGAKFSWRYSAFGTFSPIGPKMRARLNRTLDAI